MTWLVDVALRAADKAVEALEAYERLRTEEARASLGAMLQGFSFYPAGVVGTLRHARDKRSVKPVLQAMRWGAVKLLVGDACALVNVEFMDGYVQNRRPGKGVLIKDVHFMSQAPSADPVVRLR